MRRNAGAAKDGGLDPEFHLSRAFDIGATATFAITGALAGVRRHYDVVGVFFLAAATALGGGLIRDAVLLRTGVPIAIQNPIYLETVIAACGLGFVLGKRIRHFERWIMLADALGLGAYAIVGTQMSLQEHLAPVAALLVGVLNATGGGLLRDVLAREEPFVFKPGEFYLLVALAGAVAFWLLLRYGHQSATHAAAIAIGLTFILRLLTVRFKWRTRAIVELAD